MVKKLKLAELLALLLVVLVTVVVIGKYARSKAMKQFLKNREQMFELGQNEFNYWKYILAYREVFSGSNIKLENRKLVIDYDKSDIDKPELTSESIPVLLYHGITDTPKVDDVTKQTFLSHMIALKRNGYQPISMADLYQFVQGKKELTSKSILITFDDGRKDDYYNGDPILRILGFKASIFIITDHSLGEKKSKYYLNQTELQHMLKGEVWDIQSHGEYDHYPIVVDADNSEARFIGSRKWLVDENRQETWNEYRDRISTDMLNSKKDIEQVSKVPVLAYAFPYGDFGQNDAGSTQTSEIALNTSTSIFPISFIQFRSEKSTGYYSYAYKSDFVKKKVLKRILMTNKITADNLLEILNAGKPKQLPYVYKKNQAEWIAESSNHMILAKDDRIEIQLMPNKKSESAYLDGTHDWKNYNFSGNFNPIGVEQIGMVGRSIDGNNFLSCIFGDGQVYLDQTIDGKTSMLRKYSHPSFYVNDNESITLSMTIKDNTVSCNLGNRPLVIYNQVNQLLFRGGIGYKIWGVQAGQAMVAISNIQADAQ